MLALPLLDASLLEPLLLELMPDSSAPFSWTSGATVNEARLEGRFAEAARVAVAGFAPADFVELARAGLEGRADVVDDVSASLRGST